MVDEPLSGQWAVVTGGSKGIGLGVARSLAHAGANVVIVARELTVLEQARVDVSELAGRRTKIVTRAVDLADPSSLRTLFEWIRSSLPQLNIVVVNAGAGSLVPFLEITAEHWQQTLALNLTAAFSSIQEAARIMVEMPPTENRSIVAISSIRATGVRPGLAAYAATKAALNTLVRSAAAELASTGIRVNAVSPGVTRTALFETTLQTHPDLLERRVRDIPMGRLGSLDDMASAVRFLCLPDAQFITGANFVVDGGESLH